MKQPIPNTSTLFSSVALGPYMLKNRIVMPPLTRSRSTQPDNIANDLMASYYAQRATAGFMVTEGTQIEPRGQGYAWTPGIHSPAQIEGWKKVTQAVHAKGSIIFAQLWHVGRISDPIFLNGETPVAPSAIAAGGHGCTHSPPRLAAAQAEIPLAGRRSNGCKHSRTIDGRQAVAAKPPWRPRHAASAPDGAKNAWLAQRAK